MSFWNNPQYDSIKIAALVIVLAGAGFFVYRYMHSVTGLTGSVASLDGNKAETKPIYGIPVAKTLPATNITSTGAVLNGFVAATTEINRSAPNFLYGKDTKYGQTAPAFPDKNGTSATATVVGLAPCTTYHYRVTMTNSTGTSNGADMTFRTLGTCGPSAPAALNGSHN